MQMRGPFVRLGIKHLFFAFTLQYALMSYQWRAPGLKFSQDFSSLSLLVIS